MGRHELRAYIEALRLPVAPAVVVQVLLALLGLDGSGGKCDLSRFIGLLLSPPPLEKLEFVTALWGAIGEPAASIVERHRRRERSREAAGKEVCAGNSARGNARSCANGIVATAQ